MATERDKCGLSSLMPMSCRGRAEAFARRLHSRLSTLGTDDDNGLGDETTWLTNNHDNLSQPRHAVEAEVFFDFGLLESPGSPETEIDESELNRLWNRSEQLRKTLNSVADSRSNDSDSSDGPFYDTQEFLYNHSNGSLNLVNGSTKHTNGTCEPQAVYEGVQTALSIENGTKAASVNGCSEKTHNGYSSSNETPDQSDNSSTEKCSINNLKNLVQDFTKHNGVNKLTDKFKELSVECADKESDDSNEEQEESSPRVRRCSSLKTGKTPPGTPGSKKIVRFADALGLDLADVRTFLDEIPKIPISAYEDLTGIDIRDPTNDDNFLNKSSPYVGVKTDKLLVPLFQQPSILINFQDSLRDNLVCLETAVVDDPMLFSIRGAVRVRNLDFHKSVHIRYTMDSWRTYVDVQAVYVENSCDGFSDKFTFIIYAHTISVGQRLEFAVRFQCKGCQYWDNNKGVNYCFQCLPATNTTPYSPITCIDDWGASFY